jgi:tripartite-type tricarboxylate transporter receptor subunit TctC
MKHVTTKLLALGLGLVSSSGAFAAYPDRVITYIVPFAAGGANDVGTRILEPFLEKCLGGDVVVLNKPGAGGMIGMTELANAPPDGYTIGSLPVPNLPLGIITNPSVRISMDSFDYLASLISSRVGISVKQGGKFNSIQDLLAAAKTSPVQAAISSLGNDDHLMLLRLMQAAGVKFDFIPMADAPTARNAVIGGHIDVLALSVTESANFKDQLKTLAVAGEDRFPPLPDAPTLRELGYDIVGGNTFAMGAPKGLPVDVKAKLDQCFQQAGKDPGYNAEAQKRNFVLAPMDGVQTETFIKGEYATFKKLWDADPWIK